MNQQEYTPPFIEGKRKSSISWKLVVIFVVLLLFIPLCIGVIQVYQNFSLPSSVPTPAPTTIAFPTDTPTPTISPTAILTPTPTPKGNTVDAHTGLDKSTLTVVVENGSGKAGAATKASEVLKLAGYTIVATKNADSYDYLDVTISIKPEKAAYLPLLKQDLLDVYTIADTNTTLDASSSADAVVIVGR